MKSAHTTIKIVALAAVATVLAACETPPARPLMSAWEASTGFGYSERRLDKARFEVSFTTPFVRTVVRKDQRKRDTARIRALAYDIGLWRAAEIALREKFVAFEVEDKQGDVVIERYDDTPRVQRYGLAHPLAGYRFTQSAGPRIRSTWVQGKSVLVIAMKKAVGNGALDARKTIARMARKHANARSMPAY